MPPHQWENKAQNFKKGGSWSRSWCSSSLSEYLPAVVVAAAEGCPVATAAVCGTDRLYEAYLAADDAYPMENWNRLL